MSDDPRTQEPGHDRLLDHEYDGIREYDNPMPKWWLWIFYATILYSVLYTLNVVPGLGSGPGRIAAYEADVAAARAKLAAAAPAAGPAMTDAGLLALAVDTGTREAGRQVYVNNCAACHREDGGGSIGPNLTDDYWLHGARPTEILTTVNTGVLDKGMPAWGEVLKPADVQHVVAYVTTLHGTHPPNPKEPQGSKVEEEDRRERGGAAEADGESGNGHR
jgi:cytochrome c oxidase cbb3-type subunit 3